MTHVVLTFIMALLVLIPVSASSPWTPIAEKVKQSVVFLENCTGFVIDQQRHYILTAAHCLPEDETKILVDGEKAYRVWVDNRKDFLVLRAPGVDKPALRLSPDRMQLAVGIGRDAETIKDRAGRYFEEKP
jgi:S1-C subfamily serine protease